MSNIYEKIVLEDIPFEIFALFSRERQSVHAGVLLLTASLCSEDVEGAVSCDLLADVIRTKGLIPDKEKASQPQSPENQELAILKNYRLLRRQSRYNEQERRWEDYFYLTGLGRKVADFLVYVSQTDIQQTKEANIQSALLSMREAGNSSPSKDILLYDALKAAHEGIADLITHLSTFSGTFRDFIEKNTKRIENAEQAKQWIDTMFRSNLLMEYFTIVDTAYVYASKLGEIRTIAEKLQENSLLTGRIIDQEYKRRQEIEKRTPQIKASYEEIKKDVYNRIRRLKEMTDYEYHGYMEQIQKLVNQVIERTYFVFTSFGAGDDSGTVVHVLTKLIRYATIENVPVPLSVSNIFEQWAIDGGSFCKCPEPDNGNGEAPLEIPDTNIITDDDGTSLSWKEDALEMAKRIVPPGGTVCAEDFPCVDMDDYLMMFYLSGYADHENNPASEFEFTPDSSVFRKGDFILPGGRYTRDMPEKTEDK